MKKHLLYLLLFLSACQPNEEDFTSIQVLVIGEGTGATAAAIQSARSGAQTILVTPSPWLGGMLTSAGVSATDGNHQMPAGLWGEFRDSLRKHYGGADSLFTGWVSNTMFEPKVGEYYWKQMAKRESNLEIWYDAEWMSISKEGTEWKVEVTENESRKIIQAKVVIDGTDLGDIAAAAGATFDIGMDARSKTQEAMAPENANDIIQDLTYAAILKDFGKGTNKTITKPEGYDRTQFLCACGQNCDDPNAKPKPHPCETMLSYGKLPNGKYMINWPIKGNDYYANIIEKSKEERAKYLAKAKNKTLQFIYYIQTELGYEHLGIAKDEFPTDDGLPLMPYHREGRRIHGLVQLNVNHVLKPYAFDLYRTGIAVGDYPIDHHHYERLDAPEIDFPKVPSFSIPAGALIPKGVDHLLIADKAISVTNIVNGSSRLQPVIVQVGQAAGLMAAMAVQQEISPKQLNVRQIQEALLKAKGYLMPFVDVKPDHPQFESIQKIGATGLIQGTGIPYQWANQTWFYPDSTISRKSFFENLKNFDSEFIAKDANENWLTIEQTLQVFVDWLGSEKDKQADNKKVLMAGLESKWTQQWKLDSFDASRPIKRKELAVVLDQLARLFYRPVNFEGEWMQ